MIYIFDIDGTLTPARQPMLPEHEQVFLEFARRHREDPIYFITGSDYRKVVTQLPLSVEREADGIFCCLGNELVWRGNYVYRSFWPEVRRPDLIAACNKFWEGSPYTVRTGIHIEERTGMLNVSSVGRNADVDQRQEYLKWDFKHKERKAFCELINKEFPEVEATIGGMISVDISKRGKDKSQILPLLASMGLWKPITYFGDRYEVGGNDFPIMSKLYYNPNRVVRVDDYEDTFDELSML